MIAHAQLVYHSFVRRHHQITKHGITPGKHEFCLLHIYDQLVPVANPTKSGAKMASTEVGAVQINTASSAYRMTRAFLTSFGKLLT